MSKQQIFVMRLRNEYINLVIDVAVGEYNADLGLMVKAAGEKLKLLEETDEKATDFEIIRRKSHAVQFYYAEGVGE